MVKIDEYKSPTEYYPDSIPVFNFADYESGKSFLDTESTAVLLDEKIFRTNPLRPITESEMEILLKDLENEANS